MDLRQLHYLVAIADEGSVTAAAAASLVAQPSLSASIKALERELGVALLRRAGRGVTLTAAGEAAVGAGREALRAADNVRARVAAVRGVLAGRLDLVVLPTLAADPVARFIGSFRSAHSGVLVRVTQPESTADVLAALREGRSELAVTELPSPVPGLISVPLGEQELVAVLPPGGARPSRRAMPVEELAGLAFVAAPVGTSSRRVLDEALAGIGVLPRIAVEVDQREMIVPLVLAGAGAAVLPANQAAEAAGLGADVRRLTPRLHRSIALVHPDAGLSPAGAAFVDVALAGGRRGIARADSAELPRERRRT